MENFIHNLEASLGVSTINFEEVAKEPIFKSINNSKLTALKILKEAYAELKNRIGRVPYLYDFVASHSIDPVVLSEAYSNYYQFLQKVKEEVPPINEYENSVLTMLSLEILNGKRRYEIALLDLILKKEIVRMKDYLSHLKDLDCRMDEDIIASVRNIFDLSFFTQNNKKKYGDKLIIIFHDDERITFNEKFEKVLNQMSISSIWLLIS